MIPYLETGWRRPQLPIRFAAASLSPRAARRGGKSPAEALSLLDLAVPGAALIDAMRGRSILVDRPRFCAPKGVRLCRPSDAGAPSLVAISRIVGPMTPVSKENGQKVLDALRHRVI